MSKKELMDLLHAASEKLADAATPPSEKPDLVQTILMVRRLFKGGKNVK